MVKVIGPLPSELESTKIPNWIIRIAVSDTCGTTVVPAVPTVYVRFNAQNSYAWKTIDIQGNYLPKLMDASRNNPNTLYLKILLYYEAARPVQSPRLQKYGALMSTCIRAHSLYSMVKKSSDMPNLPPTREKTRFSSFIWFFPPTWQAETTCFMQSVVFSHKLLQPRSKCSAFPVHRSAHFSALRWYASLKVHMHFRGLAVHWSIALQGTANALQVRCISIWEISPTRKKMTANFICYFSLTSDKPKLPLSGSVDHRIWVCPKYG